MMLIKKYKDLHSIGNQYCKLAMIWVEFIIIKQYK